MTDLVPFVMSISNHTLGGREMYFEFQIGFYVCRLHISQEPLKHPQNPAGQDPDLLKAVQAPD